MAMGVTSNCLTTPRKRRPRAVGEVFITSESCVYLNDSSAIIPETSTIENSHEPVYENAGAPPLPLRRNRKANKLNVNNLMEEINKTRPFAFNSFRISMPDQKLNESPCESSPSTASAPVAPIMETQYISVFIGENFNST